MSLLVGVFTSPTISHGAEDAWFVTVGEHLAFRQSPHGTRRLREQLERLRVQHGWTEKERNGREYWRLTAADALHLALTRAEGMLGDLPESPQHRTWRKARAAATERIEDFKALPWQATEEATDFEGVADPPPSAWLFELSERLGAAFWLVDSALYCRDEWPEPSDDCIDTIPIPADPQGAAPWGPGTYAKQSPKETNREHQIENQVEETHHYLERAPRRAGRPRSASRARGGRSGCRGWGCRPRSGRRPGAFAVDDDLHRLDSRALVGGRHRDRLRPAQFGARELAPPSFRVGWETSLRAMRTCLPEASAPEADRTAFDGTRNIAFGHATCAKGERVISGGIRQKAGGAGVVPHISTVESGPVPNKRGWYVSMSSDLGGAAR